ncbi:hypothetical protein [Haloferula sargassicola]|uniref:hypothetical protein n=1 Tax=Haloferula sargassicola TaxID=490096 RepID=UPI003365607A
MIDLPKRLKFAEALRQLLAGTITNIEFDRRDFEDTADAGIYAIWHSIWLCYDDFLVHPLKITDGQKLDFERCILFLHSEVEYEWPDSEPYFRRAAKALSDILQRLCGNYPKDCRPEFDFGVWPFSRREDFEFALEHPRLLAKKAQPKDSFGR